MSVPFKKRFAGREAEIVQYVKTFGLMQAMDKYEARDLLAWQTYIDSLTGDKNTGWVAPHPSKDLDHLAEKIVDKIMSRLTQLTARVEELEKEKDDLFKRIKVKDNNNKEEEIQKGIELLSLLESVNEEASSLVFK
ncbi:hypothetical protein [Dehalococcoides mccartyi]|uniref:hypothetical protein n=1 Tax=Dehalococcoides mccartyi TaxID=61435 RepID=UPI00080488B3|nr:hypothetical protein [Dehalococcoides mccartyi]OBW61975.1 MAG: hypothetical protein A9181_03130 [Dehalococcoides mccartyi]BEL00791.1 hypothetical protein DMOBY_06440 [Dehalococcoides mccartyi]